MPLKQTLRNMLSQAQHTGQPARTHLAKGLTVSIRIAGDLVDLQLSRVEVFPAAQEWKTILGQWPGQCVVVKPPKPLRDAKQYYLRGQLRLVPALVEEPDER